MAFDMLLRRMKADAYTTHGFRSGFRDWTGDATSFPAKWQRQPWRTASAMQPNAPIGAADALDKRRKLMTAWADYCAAAQDDRIVSMVRP